MFQVTIQPSGHRITVNSGEAILDAALCQSLTLPYGCRDGACGSCKGKIVAGNVDYGSYQESALTEAEKRLGMVLLCQAVPLTDLVVEVREVSAAQDIKPRMLPCRVESLTRAAADVMIMRLQLPAGERLQFLAGQYLDILLKDGKRRSFSLANPPHADVFLELHLRQMAPGGFTEQVFTRMKQRDILRFEGPLGTFFLREDSDKPIIFVASGTGFAPIKAIIEHAFHLESRRPMTLYWGGRTLPDLYMADLAGRWQTEHEHFSFIPVLSEAPPESRWPGRTGLVHQAVLEDFDDLSGHQVYVCGNPLMVEAARRDFTALRGLPAEELYSDPFTPAQDGPGAN